MATVFDELSDGFYTAFFESSARKRKQAIDAWVKSAIKEVQASVASELRAHVDWLLEQRWTDEGWASGVQKLSRRMDSLRLVMDIKIREPNRAKDKVVGALSERTRAKTIEKAESALAAIGKTELAKTLKPKRTAAATGSSPDDDGDYDGGSRSANDDRSDSMNPNNDAYQAAMDNRSDQMNPNNPAYHSSRGGGRGR